MRSTIHLVAAEDALAWRPLLQPVIERTLDARYKRRLGDIDRSLGEQWPEHPDPAALAEVIRAHVPLVQVPPRGLWGESGPAAHTSAQAWLG
jgi:hypothetical protein